MDRIGLRHPLIAAKCVCVGCTGSGRRHALPANVLVLRTDLESCGSEFDLTLTALGIPMGTVHPGSPEEGWRRQVEV